MHTCTLLYLLLPVAIAELMVERDGDGELHKLLSEELRAQNSPNLRKLHRRDNKLENFLVGRVHKKTVHPMHPMFPNDLFLRSSEDPDSSEEKEMWCGRFGREVGGRCLCDNGYRGDRCERKFNHHLRIGK